MITSAPCCIQKLSPAVFHGASFASAARVANEAMDLNEADLAAGARALSAGWLACCRLVAEKKQAAAAVALRTDCASARSGLMSAQLLAMQRLTGAGLQASRLASLRPAAGLRRSETTHWLLNAHCARNALVWRAVSETTVAVETGIEFSAELEIASEIAVALSASLLQPSLRWSFATAAVVAAATSLLTQALGCCRALRESVLGTPRRLRQLARTCYACDCRCSVESHLPWRSATSSVTRNTSTSSRSPVRFPEL